MPQADVEIVRAVFEAWNDGNLESVTDLLAKDVQWPRDALAAVEPDR